MYSRAHTNVIFLIINTFSSIKFEHVQLNNNIFCKNCNFLLRMKILVFKKSINHSIIKMKKIFIFETIVTRSIFNF